MRTTIDLPDDLHRAVKVIAESSGVSLSETIATMVRSFLPQPPGRTSIDPVTGLMVLSGGPRVTAAQVRAWIGEDEDHEIDR